MTFTIGSSGKPVADKTSTKVDVLSKFSYLETGSDRLQNNDDNDYEDSEMNEYDQMNEKFKDVDEIMGNTTKNGGITSITKTSRHDEDEKRLNAITESQRLQNNENNEDNQMNERLKDVNEIMGDPTKNGAGTLQIKTSKQNDQEKKVVRPHLIGYKKHNIELNVWNDLTSQGRSVVFAK